MIKKRVLAIFLSVFMLFGIIDNNCFSVEAAEEQQVLNVALYGYVPDTERFENAVAEQWEKVQPNVELNFVEWDCYEDVPNEQVDVFVFDAIYLLDYIDKGYLLPLAAEDIENSEDILNFALEGCTYNDTIYAIPQIICTNLLYYREGDETLANVDSIDELYQVLGNRQSEGVIPQNNEGLLVDMSGGTGNVCFYLDGLIDHNQSYSDYYNLPSTTEFNSEVVSCLRMMQSMGGKEQVQYWPDDNDAYVRAKWFQNGYGRAYLGYTEAMSSMGNYVQNIDFKVISYCKEENIPLFYGDLVGINSGIETEKKEYAIELANVIGDTETMVEAISPNEKNVYPQYLLPARESVYEVMGENYPIYNELYSIVDNPDNKLFLLGVSAEQWIEAAKNNLESALNQN